MNAGRARILLVEDERLVAREIAENLRELGYEVPPAAASAEEALAIAEREPPHLVLLDIRIRGARDGVDTAEALRARFGVPIVYLTACTDQPTIGRAKRTEPYAYLVKPIKPVELRSAVEIALYKAEIDRRVREREAWHRATLSSILDAVVSTDAAGFVTFMNRSAEVLTGVTLQEATGQHYSSILPLLDENTRQTAVHPIARALEERTGDHRDEALVLLGGGRKEHLVQSSAAPLLDESGQLLGAVMVFRDVSERRQLVRQAESNERLAALGTLAAGVAHEINNPLAFILGNLEYALGVLEALESSSRAGPVETDTVATRVHDVCAALADARTGAERVRTIVAELRRLARPPSEKREALDLRRILEAALSVTARQVSECATVVREFGDCPRVQADATRLTQVFVNLLLNAVLAIQERKSAPNEVRLRTGTDEAGNAYAEVADTGVGIAHELLPRIFEPFFTTRSLLPGAGLGLAVAHGIVASLGGSIQVRSAPGSGSLFRVVLPASPETKPPTDQAAALHRAQTNAKRLLVIDDEKFLLDTLVRVLEEDYEVTTAHGGHQALELLQSGERFDLILSDLLMPGVTGMDLFTELEKHHPAHASRIVFMTGGAFTARAQRFLAAGQHAVLEKPFTSNELLDFLERCYAKMSSKTGP